MCTVSNIGDNYRDNFAPRWPNVPIYPTQPTIKPTEPGDWADSWPLSPPARLQQHVSKEEFDALKKEVEELKQLLKAAKKFDEETGQPDCHMDDKVDFIKKLAEFVGVDLEDIFKT